MGHNCLLRSLIKLPESAYLVSYHLLNLCTSPLVGFENSKHFRCVHGVTV